jgi:hypothetical protein
VTKTAKRKASRSRRGPEPFRPSSSDRSDVMLLVATGMSFEGISDAMEISRRTLCRTFVRELAIGRAKKMLENLKRLEAAAKSKNVAAMKYLHTLMASHGDSAGADHWAAVANRIEADMGVPANLPKNPELVN